MKKTDVNIPQLQKTILQWYKKNGREGLPWREVYDTPGDLYKITVSEIMLQQTNVPKVIEKFREFLVRFPTVEKLAQARQSSVLKQWQGLGYNRRAMNLHKMARVIVKDFGGVFPETPEELESLPGIGPYTKNAVLAFGRNKNVSAVDVNIERFARRVTGQKTWDKLPDMREFVASLVPRGRSRDWHNALMDFGSTICTKRKPSCATCPLKDVCASYPDPQDYSAPKKKEVGRSEKGKHIPRRIYRGRIIEVLRSGEGVIEIIGKEIKKDWSEDDQVWLQEILDTLSKEGMITYKKNSKKWKLR